MRPFKNTVEVRMINLSIFIDVSKYFICLNIIIFAASNARPIQHLIESNKLWKKCRIYINTVAINNGYLIAFPCCFY